jgi:hypothetical protein
MSNDVFANGREVSCKAAAGKSIAAFPDVAFTPPKRRRPQQASPLLIPIPDLEKIQPKAAKRSRYQAKKSSLRINRILKNRPEMSLVAHLKKALLQAK